MVDITLLKVELDGNPQFSPSWMSGDEGRSRANRGTTVTVDDEESGNGGKVLIGLGALVLVAAVVRKGRGGDDEEEFDTEPEYTVEEPA